MLRLWKTGDGGRSPHGSLHVMLNVWWVGVGESMTWRAFRPVMNSGMVLGRTQIARNHQVSDLPGLHF
jgi:hypothetical protein